MRHPVRWILVGMLATPILLVMIANGIATSPDELPPPDPQMLITMPDGRQEPLVEVLAQSDIVQEVTGRDRNGEPVQHETRTYEEPVDIDTDEILEQLREMRVENRTPEDGDIYGLAEYALANGDTDQALALLRSLPEEHPRYGRAQRKIGWDIYTREMDDPSRGLGFVNRSIREDPTEGNAWQDAFRVYAATLGFLVN